MRTNEKKALVADGWLILDYVSNTDIYELTLEYYDGDELKLKVSNNYSDALGAFLKFYEKNK
jgi:hypothetical protein